MPSNGQATEPEQMTWFPIFNHSSWTADVVAVRTKKREVASFNTPVLVSYRYFSTSDARLGLTGQTDFDRTVFSALSAETVRSINKLSDLEHELWQQIGRAYGHRTWSIDSWRRGHEIRSLRVSKEVQPHTTVKEYEKIWKRSEKEVTKEDVKERLEELQRDGGMLLVWVVAPDFWQEAVRESESSGRRRRELDEGHERSELGVEGWSPI